VRRHQQRGQALIELAIIFPLILFVFLGAWTGAALIANQDSVAQATGYGARIAAELGNTCAEVSGSLSCTRAIPSCQQSAADPCAVDGEILSALMPSLHQLSNSTPKDIYIYQPASCQPVGGTLPALSTCTTADGAPVLVGVAPPAGALDDQYQYCSSGAGSWVLQNGVGTKTGTAPCYTNAGIGPYWLTYRTQPIDNEQAIGVAVKFLFTPPGLKWFTQTDSAYTAITFPPEGS
jgi:hypothetical protein